ncbi:GtrA family protein [Neisseriaceae bacterium ESL0693]|nr:GtrA family protein [Neisseriaceae bacterium ESL0693]
MGQSRFKTLVLPSETLWFVVVGALAAGTHLTCLFIAVRFMHILPKYANILAFMLAFLVSFAGHYRLTFQATTQIWHQALWRWLCSAIIGFCLNQLLFLWGLHLFGQQQYLWTWLVVTLLVTLLTFLMGKFWAFHGKDSA